MGILALIIRQVGLWRRQTTDATDKLIPQLTERLDKVERQLNSEGRLHFIEIRRMEARHSAQRSLDHHKLNNSEANLDAFAILELSSEKAPEAARRAREHRVQQRHAEQLESTKIHKAEMAAVAQAERELREQEEQA